MDLRDVGTDSAVYDKNMDMLINTVFGKEMKEAILILFMYHQNVLADIIQGMQEA